MIPDLEVTATLKPHIEFLSKAWEPRRGVSFATNYSVKDSDDSVITYSTLLRFGIEKDLASVLAYEEKRPFPLLRSGGQSVHQREYPYSARAPPGRVESKDILGAKDPSLSQEDKK